MSVRISLQILLSLPGALAQGEECSHDVRAWQKVSGMRVSGMRASGKGSFEKPEGALDNTIHKT